MISLFRRLFSYLETVDRKHRCPGCYYCVFYHCRRFGFSTSRYYKPYCKGFKAIKQKEMR
jgi:hypothetical protein